MPKGNIYTYFSYTEYQLSKIFKIWKKCFSLNISRNIVNKNSDRISIFYQNLLNFDAICDYFIVTDLINYFTLRKKRWYSESFWSVFSRIWTEYWVRLRIFPYSIWMRETMDQNNCKYGRFLRSVSENISLQTGIVVITTLQLYTTKARCRFLKGS